MMKFKHFLVLALFLFASVSLAKDTGNLRVLGDLNANKQFCLLGDCRTVWPAGATGAQYSGIDPLIVDNDQNRIFIRSVVTDLNAGSGITLNCDGSDTNGSCEISSTASGSSDINWSQLNAIIPWADANIVNSARFLQDASCDNNAGCTLSGTLTGSAPNYALNSILASLFPVPDANIANSTRYLQDSSCDNNANCNVLFGTIVDVNGNISYGWLATNNPDLALPAIDGNSNKFLTNDGTQLIWQAVTGGSGGTYLAGANINIGDDNVIHVDDGNLALSFYRQADANLVFSTQSDVNTGFVRNSVFNAFYPVADANISNATRFLQDASCDNNAGCTLSGTLTGSAPNYVLNSILASLFPVPDANIANSARYLQDASCDNNGSCSIIYGTITDINGNIQDYISTNLSGFTRDAVFNAAFDSDFNVTNATRLLQDASCDNNTGCTLIYGSIQDINTNIQDFINNNLTGFVKDGVFQNSFPVADANILGATRFLQDASCDNNGSCTLIYGAIADINGNIQDYIDGSLTGFTRDAVFNAAWPVADANVGNATRYLQDASCDANTSCVITGTVPDYVSNAVLATLFPVPDANILNATRFSQDASCDGNASCVILYSTIQDINTNISYGWLATSNPNLVLPHIDGNSGKVLSNDGSQLVWATDQTGAGGGAADGNCDNNSDCTITGTINTDINAIINNGADFNINGGRLCDDFLCYNIRGLTVPSDPLISSLGAKPVNRENLGLVWSDIGALSGEIRVRGLACAGNGICISAGDKIYRSTDYLKTWTDTGYSGGQVLSLEYLGDGIFVAGVAGSPATIIRSTDYGSTWSTVLTTSAETHIYGLANLGNCIALAGTNPGGLVYRTTNCGETWSNTGQLENETNVFGLEKVGGNYVIAGGAFNPSDGNVFTSSDLGLSWTNLGHVVPGVVDYDYFEYLGNGIVLGATYPDAHIIRSTDNGYTWTDLGSYGTWSTLGFATAGNGTVIAGTSYDSNSQNGNAFYSNNYGADWNLLGSAQSLLNSADQNLAIPVYAGQSVFGFGTHPNGHILRSVGFTDPSVNDGNGTTYTGTSPITVSGSVISLGQVTLTDANIPNDITASNYVLNSVLASLFPLPDANISSVSLSKILWDNNSIVNYGWLRTSNPNLVLPHIDGNSGKVLSNDGSQLVWATDQTGAGGGSDTNIFTHGAMDADSNRFVIDFNVTSQAGGGSGWSFDTDTNLARSPSNGTGTHIDNNGTTICIGWSGC